MKHILSTTNYDQFKDIASNREVDQRHVAHLMHSMLERNLLELNPILVNSQLEVIDGQHRLQAAKQLQVPIYYVVSEDITESDIHRINSNAKNWQTMDYIKYWTVKKQPGFQELSSMINKYPHIPLTSMMQLLHFEYKRDTKALRSGTVDVSMKDRAEKVIEMLRDYRDKFMFSSSYTSGFICAIAHIAEVEGFSHDEMMRKLEMQPRSLVKCINWKQYVRLLEEVYNHRTYGENKIRFI